MKNLSLFFLCLTCFTIKCVNYTWNGSTDNMWTNSANWTPNGVPGSADNVTIAGSTANYPSLSSSLSVNNFIMNSNSTFDISTYLFIPTGTSILTGALITGTSGYLKLNGGSSTIISSTLQSRTRISCSTYTLTNSVFDRYLLLQKAGVGISNSTGNVFNDTLWVESNGTGALRFGVGTHDTYNAIVILKNYSTGDVSMGYNSSGNVFNGSIEVNSSTGGNINFGIGGGTSQLYPGFKIYEGAEGFVRGWLEIRNFTQFGSTLQTLNLLWTGASSGSILGLRIGPGATFNGSVVFSASNIFLNGATYNGVSSTFQKVSGGGSNLSTGGNVFNSAITNIENTTSSLLRMANVNADTYNTTIHFYRGISTTQLEVAYNGLNSFTGDIYIDCGTATSTNVISFGSGSGTVMINGTAPQNIYRLSPTKIPAPVIKYLCINKISGNFILNTAVDIVLNLMLMNGVISASSTNSLLIDVGGTCNLGNNLSYVDGPISLRISSTGPTAMNFPLGKNGAYRPAILNVTHNDVAPVIYDGELIGTSANSLGYSLPPTLNLVSLMRYWQISREAIPNLSAAVVTLFYDSDDGVPDPSFLSVAKTNGAGNSWTDIGGTGSAAVSGSITSGSFITFSKFALGNKIGGLNPLPIELAEFSAKPLGDQVEVNWITASEKNNCYFTIEKTSDGHFFEEVATIKTNGNSFTNKNYSAIDAHPFEGISYYRLKQTDVDGTTKAYKFVSVDMPKKTSLKIFPNPSDGNFEIQFDNYSFEKIEILDELGKKIYQSESYGTANRNCIKIKIADQAKPGIYTVLLKDREKTIARKINIL
ncbi:T9SS type A sorting domain-containing protein [Aurantibacillus circumpalustris]|uniref:T9SS type A sorting domain-containing protein n=1 Tax=Aurantibacillus circumpalustris TaxID=3036359 RepID=UPI00295C1238|nr:T9SS type A sorting domain-containing protein [Aurantibacillus circumpalustris]